MLVLRRVALRTAWLMVGAAIGLAVGLLAVSIATLLTPGGGLVAAAIAIAIGLLAALLIGLLPGVRELEVAAATTMLGVVEDLVVPIVPRPDHRWRTVLVTTFHLTAGLLTAILLVGLLPGAIAVAAAGVQGRAVTVAGITVPGLSPGLALLLGVGLVGAALVGAVGLGRLGAAVARWSLGPTAYDQLQVALDRLTAEAAHTRLARELHDGIGHALTIINLQAAGARVVLASDPREAEQSLAAIETTARQALAELDGVLGLLRDDAAPDPSPGLDELPRLLQTYRATGMDLSVECDPLTDLPRLASTTGYRIVAEALTNARRYAAPGPVRLAVRRTADRLRVSVTNHRDLGPDLPLGTGRGLQGMAERVALFGGSLDAGAVEHDWVVRAEIPVGLGGDPDG